MIGEIIEGDCVEYMDSIDESSIDLIVTDPPWGIGYDTPRGASRSKKHATTKIVSWGKIRGDESPDGGWLRSAYRVLKVGGAIYVMTRQDVETSWKELIIKSGFIYKQRLVWHKRDHGKGDLKGTWATTCEDVIFSSKGRHILNHRYSMLIDVGKVPTWEMRDHPHQKPVGLSRRLIEASSNPGDIVLDPFAGSGSTLIACKETGRIGIGVEIDIKYVEIMRNL